MNIHQLRKYTISAFSILVFAACFESISVSAQILKPGEIVYSRVSTSTNGSCDSAAIWAVGQDGSNDRFITLGLHPRISPDGRLLLFKRFDSSTACGPFFNGAPQWWTRDLATKRETVISYNFRISFGHYFSPDTNRADFRIINDDSNSICRMNTDGTNRRCAVVPMIDPRRGAGHLGVRGGDNLIVVQNYDTGNVAGSGLYTMNYDDFGNRQKIPNTNLNDFNPAWSNDGQTIAYTRIGVNRGANYPYYFDNLYKIKPDGSNQTQLTFFNNLPSNEGFSYSFVWTTDNSAIFNAARINGVAGIYRFAADGSGAFTRIPITAGAIPDWVGGIVPPHVEQQIGSFGGGAAASGNYSLVDTAGQAFAGQTSVGGSFNLQSGFWTNLQNVRAPFDFDGDGKTDVSIFRPSGGEWWINRSSSNVTVAAQFGQSTDKLVPGDYTGDGKTDAAFFRPSTGQWFILRSDDASFYGFPFGSSGDIPAPGDYDGDGKTDAAVFRPANAVWFIQRSTAGVRIQQFGAATDRPVPNAFVP